MTDRGDVVDIDDDPSDIVREAKKAAEDRMGRGPVGAENLAEVVRSMRHEIGNAAGLAAGAWHLTKLTRRQSERLANVAHSTKRDVQGLSEDLFGVPGQRDIDDGGAIGRLRLRVEGLYTINAANHASNRRMLLAILGAVGAMLLAVIGSIITQHITGHYP